MRWSARNYLTLVANRMLNLALIFFLWFQFYFFNIIYCTRVCGKIVLLVLEASNFHSTLTCWINFKAKKRIDFFSFPAGTVPLKYTTHQTQLLISETQTTTQQRYMRASHRKGYGNGKRRLIKVYLIIIHKNIPEIRQIALTLILT